MEESKRCVESTGGGERKSAGEVRRGFTGFILDLGFEERIGVCCLGRLRGTVLCRLVCRMWWCEQTGGPG